jgi:RsiW-degrading membrane proteinase PrsW (M82 family)
VSTVQLARRLHPRSFLRPEEPAFWAFSILLAIGAASTIGTLAELSQVSRSGWILAWALLSLYAVPVAIVVYRLDLYEREPVPLAIAALAWGALGATGLSIRAAGWGELLTAALGPGAATWGSAVVTPVTEELLKAAGIVLLAMLARDEFHDMMDGFVYGAFVGLGFAIVEDVVYFMAVFGGTPAGVLEGFGIRVLASGLYGHVLYSALIGMAVGLLAAEPDDDPPSRRWTIAAGLVGAAFLGHIVWNLPGLTPAGGVASLLLLAIKGVPLLVFVVVAVRMAHRRERRWLDRALATPVVAEIVEAREAAVLRDPAARRRSVAAMRRRAGRTAASLLRRLQREQVNLAMIVNEAPGDTAAIAAQAGLCRSLRLALGAIPGAAARGSAS